MYDGPEEEITLRFNPELMNQIVDRFGTDLKLSKKKKNSLDVTVNMHLSPTFYGWLFQCVGKMTVVSPAYVCEQYAEKMQNGIDDVLGI